MLLDKAVQPASVRSTSSQQPHSHQPLVSLALTLVLGRTSSIAWCERTLAIELLTYGPNETDDPFAPLKPENSKPSLPDGSTSALCAGLGAWTETP